MIGDLRLLQEGSDQPRARAYHLAGDARHLNELRLRNGELAFPDRRASLSLFSPPYLNFIDYTELYKLELYRDEYLALLGALGVLVGLAQATATDDEQTPSC